MISNTAGVVPASSPSASTPIGCSRSISPRRARPTSTWATRPAGRPPHDLGADPGVRDIDEVAPPGRGGEPARVEGAPAIRGQPGGDVLGATRAGNTATQVGAGAAL